jgi:hypothetical protein
MGIQRPPPGQGRSVQSPQVLAPPGGSLFSCAPQGTSPARLALETRERQGYRDHGLGLTASAGSAYYLPASAPAVGSVAIADVAGPGVHRA